MNRILASVMLFFAMGVASLAIENSKIVGEYNSTGTHPWTLKLKEDNRFDVVYSDAGGFREWVGF